jgi:hypothetical protein
MSFEHKAFIFDLSTFTRELKPLLESSLCLGDFDKVRNFIVDNKSVLVDPYEGEPLDEKWEDMIEDRDIHQYGDFALTKYYSLADDQGLGGEWETFQEFISDFRDLNFSPFLGLPLGVDGIFFDPGKMGSYFQSENEVSESLIKIKEVEWELGNELLDSLKGYTELLERAVREKKGVYVTF